MNRTYLRPSTKAYDGMNSIEEIMGEYSAYLLHLSDKDLIREYKERRHAWLDSPTIMNVEMFRRVKSKMLEYGLSTGERLTNIEEEREM